MRVRELCVSYRPRNDLPRVDPASRFDTPLKIATFLRSLLDHEAIEVFVLVCLNTKHGLVAYHELSRGTLDSTSVHPREVFKTALLANSASVVLGHNHPSGDPTPSPDDLALTDRLARAGELLGVKVLDHVILGDQAYYSFKERGSI